VSFINELKRRHVFRTGAAYVVAAWLIIQVAETILPAFGFGEIAIRTVVIVLAIGLLPTLTIAWAFKLTPDGLKPEHLVNDMSPVSLRFEKKLDRIVMILLALGLAYFAFDKFVFGPERDAELINTTAQQVEKPAPKLSPDKSIAILPFVDMSPGGDQEYLADGIADQLLSELSRMENLKVAARTSTFLYRDSQLDLKEIGEALEVSSILEGSVRKDKDRIRVSAQLVNAVDGYQLWSRTFEKQLADIFAIQDQIAKEVAGALGVSLRVGDINSFNGAGTKHVEAYEAYLQGSKLAVLGQPNERIRKFEHAVSIDPDYAAAWAALGLTIGATMWLSPPEQAPAILDRAIPILKRAVELEPNSAQAHSLLATVGYATFDWANSEEHYVKALRLSDDGRFMVHYANMLMRSGRSDQAKNYYDSATRAEWNSRRPSWLWINADLALQDFAEARRKSQQLDYAPHRTFTNYYIALNEGDPTTIKQAIEALLPTNSAADEMYFSVLNEFDSAETALGTLRKIYKDGDLMWPSKYHDIALLAAYFDDPQFSLEVMSLESRFTTVRQGALWYPVMHGVRKLPAFRELVSDLNLVDYWRKFGWANHCRQLGDDDLVCR